MQTLPLVGRVETTAARAVAAAEVQYLQLLGEQAAADMVHRRAAAEGVAEFFADARGALLVRGQQAEQRPRRGRPITGLSAFV